ncbi:hypothetical protein [Lysobacter sp. H23M47]|uniref:hypothetical protein n=1 Tax=Lysobacter sp. H23M47 TaxID=2781024 RepID=UPI0018815DB6|nr:hypothetical protein [Lysobacter sp. H23M47]QOW24168.1 hypothetical protein INQ43_10715 [Lysobacter sp. H23M47]
MQQSTDTAYREVLKLSEALLLCQRELAQVREDQEPLMEQCSAWRAESATAQAISSHLAASLADHLSRAFWEQREPGAAIGWRRFVTSRWPRLRKLFARWRPTAAMVEAEHIRLIEASPFFQPAWYLQQHADVALACINPAAHYLHCGAAEGRDPGPEFSTRDYLERYPELAQSGVNPLVHSLQSTAA